MCHMDPDPKILSIFCYNILMNNFLDNVCIGFNIQITQVPIIIVIYKCEKQEQYNKCHISYSRIVSQVYNMILETVYISSSRKCTIV